MFSKVKRWLDGVDSKLRGSVAPSSSDSAAGRSGCRALLSETYCAAMMYSVCSSADTLFSDNVDHKLVEHLLSLAESVLTDRQKLLLVSAVQELRWNSMTLTRLCERLSRELKMSYSTVKWNIKRLVTMKLLLGGTLNSKGTKARLTKLGYLITSMLAQDESDLRCRKI